MDDLRAAPSRRRPIKLAVGVVVAVLALGVIFWTTGTSAGASAGYRTADATDTTVEQTLSTSGTADPVHQDDAEFQVAGTVSAVDVAVGQYITAGQTLASLDTTSLSQAVSSAQLSLSSDESKLTEDEDDESSITGNSSTTAATTASSAAAVTTTTTAAPTTTTTNAVTTTTAGPGGSDGSGSTALAAAQQAVISAQQTADTDATKSQADFAAAQTACAGSPKSTATTSTTSTTAPASTATGESTACADALSQSLAAQQVVVSDQKAVATAEAKLASLLSSSASSTSSTPSTGSTGSSTTSGNSGTQDSPSSTGDTGATSTSDSGGSGTGASSESAASSVDTDSAEQLASDQASIDSAQATLIDDQQDLADAQLTTPIAGTVASVGVATGQSVTADSSSDAVTIINSGSFEVTASLTTTQAPEVKVGDTAIVSVDGTSGTLTGTVARVGPVDTSGSTDTYPLIVALSSGSHDIAAGSTAQVEVVLRQVHDVLAVPTSALHVAGTHDYVEVLRSGRPVRQKVTAGVIGGADSQITSGLARGATVVLADLSEAVPSSSTSTSTHSFGGDGSFGGTGGPGGGTFGGGGGPGG